MAEKSQEKTPKKVAVILVRGRTGIKRDIRQTLEMLRLHRRNTCVVLEKTPANMGMLKKVENFTTYGEISEETLKQLIKERGEEDPGNKGKTKKYFSLNSPKKGYGRKGIKTSYGNAGALGYRGEKINDLIKRMI